MSSSRVTSIRDQCKRGLLGLEWVFAFPVATDLPRGLSRSDEIASSDVVAAPLLAAGLQQPNVHESPQISAACMLGNVRVILIGSVPDAESLGSVEESEDRSLREPMMRSEFR
jgi:hypothetical protein